MEITSNENVLKLLYSYNPWWKTGTVQTEFDKPMKRFAFYEAKKGFLNESIRRAILLSGARRTGKTTIMYQTIGYLLNEKKVPAKSILFISFDHPLLKMCGMETILDVYRQNISSETEIYCFFDELQYAADWNSWLKIWYDTMPFLKMMATGSASPILNNKVQDESGLGRWRVIPVPTLSFYEYCEICGICQPDLPKGIKPTKMYLLPEQTQAEIFMKLSDLQPHFLRYLQVGGFPELALASDDIYAQRILREDIVDKALKRDLPSIYGIRNLSDIEKVFLYLCYESSNIINVQAISKEMDGVSRATIDRYIQQLESANLIYVSPLIGLDGKKILKAKNKIYISDAAMRNAVLMNDNLEISPEELGVIAETAVYKHIKAFAYSQQATVGYFRETSGRGKEIDIVVEYGNRNKILIEVKYRETSVIKEDDAIVTMSASACPGLVVTKRDTDFGLYQYPNDKAIYKIPAFAFLYLLGLAEKEQYVTA
jgi:hypothetical protein